MWLSQLTNKRTSSQPDAAQLCLFARVNLLFASSVAPRASILEIRRQGEGYPQNHSLRLAQYVCANFVKNSSRDTSATCYLLRAVHTPEGAGRRSWKISGLRMKLCWRNSKGQVPYLFMAQIGTNSIVARNSLDTDLGKYSDALPNYDLDQVTRDRLSEAGTMKGEL